MKWASAFLAAHPGSMAYDAKAKLYVVATLPPVAQRPNGFNGVYREIV